ncbi:MAG: DUF302 domain-containing protein [Gammaproteobacteria bacterium]|nr:DUF302 domain-containing protein [Gammaproteobacteria bacterium]MBT4606001.1 DUF302 domain-containing protein [Thiotrichales bacterium]MBT3472585.1 DUF302 domain-containing protein [Gammaproteobacteria bacterium]MBT3966710.1 DUF302 domain-containing protein [Gammaproteobacteria bacterium]MBT4081392.1 DUF302 domain-containing protein [Gammaproteobacteria bacterium]
MALFAMALSSAVQAGGQGFSSLVLKFPVTDKEMSGNDIDEAIRSKSIEVGINHVFFAPLYKQVEAITGEKYRHMTIHHLCDAALAKKLADLNDDLVVMMPCRIAVVESLENPGNFSIYSTSPGVILEDPSISKEQKKLILEFMPKMRELTEAVASGDF